jgi:UDP-glucuronate 4-epimerase
LISFPPKHNNKWDTSLPDPSSSRSPFRILNIGNSQPVELGEYIKALEKSIGERAIWNSLEMQPGDVNITHADTRNLESIINYKPSTAIQNGVDKFIVWYKNYYNLY